MRYLVTLSRNPPHEFFHELFEWPIRIIRQNSLLNLGIWPKVPINDVEIDENNSSSSNFFVYFTSFFEEEFFFAKGKLSAEYVRT